MSDLTYLDFDLAIDREGDIYRAHLLQSPAGQAQVHFQRPLTDDQLENFYLRVGRTRAGVRRIDSSEMQAAKRCGERLFSEVFKDELYACWRSSLTTARAQGKGLRLRLRIHAPDLHEMPWEYLYNPSQDLFLGLSVETPIIRYFESSRPVEPLTVTPPLRVLAVIASPSDCPALDVTMEWEKLVATLEPLARAGLVALERVQPPTLDALQRRLRQGEWHVFHFMGHGRFAARNEDGELLFEDARGRGNALSGTYLGPFLRDHKPLRLAVLNACEGARASASDPFAGVAQGLVRHGIPAVIAMQFEITDQAAITFTQEFYAAIADGYPVDGALAEARKAIFAQGNDIEWGIPVLFTRSSDGRIFQVASSPRQPPVNLEELYDLGLSASLLGDWERASSYFEQILALRPDYEDAAAKLAEARALRARPAPSTADQLKQFYRSGLRAMDQGQWQQACDFLRQVVALQDDYSNAASLLRMAEARMTESQPKPQTPPTISNLPAAICLETVGGVATTLLARGTALPAKRAMIFSTAADRQAAVEVHLGFGHGPAMADTISLGKFLLDGIPPAPRGVPQIEVTIQVDQRLQLTVSAQDLATGRSKTFDPVDLSPLAPAAGAETSPPAATGGGDDRPADKGAGRASGGFDWNQWAAGARGESGVNVSSGDTADLFGGGGGDFSEFFQRIFGDTASRTPATRAVEHPLTISLAEAALGTERVLAIDQGDGQQKRLTARIPGGVRTGSKVRLTGALGQGGQDLYLVVTVADHPLFQRSGDDLVLQYPVENRRALLGRTIQAPLLEGGKTSVRLPAKITDGMEVRVAGKGVRQLNGEARGDLRIVLRPYEPDKIDQRLLEQATRIKTALEG